MDAVGRKWLLSILVNSEGKQHQASTASLAATGPFLFCSTYCPLDRNPCPANCSCAKNVWQTHVPSQFKIEFLSPEWGPSDRTEVLSGAEREASSLGPNSGGGGGRSCLLPDLNLASTVILNAASNSSRPRS